jgi:hypothetical protein
MPLKLNVGVSRTVGLPDYGSVGASCNLEIELDAGLLEHDLDGFHARIRGAYVAAHQAVHDELARLRAPGDEAAVAPAAVPAQLQSPASERNGVSRKSGNLYDPDMLLARRGRSVTELQHCSYRARLRRAFGLMLSAGLSVPLPRGYVRLPI